MIKISPNKINSFAMKRFAILAAFIILHTFSQAQTKCATRFVNASDLTLIGKVFNDTPNPYHRIDTCIYKGWTPWQNFLVRCYAGIATVFRTDSPTISVKASYGELYTGQTTNILSHKGFNLYTTGTCGRGGDIHSIQEIVDLWKCGVCYCSSSRSSFGCCDSRYCFMLSELTTFFPVCCSKASFATRATEPPLSATLACSLIV